MSGPTTYAAWADLLDRFADGDDTALIELSEGSFTIDAGTAYRFYSRVEEVYRKRKQYWLDKFQRSFQFQNFKTDNDFEIAIRNGKQNLLSLSKFTILQGLPVDLQKTLQSDLEAFVGEVKKSLKANVSKISSGREKMLILLNTFDQNIFSDKCKSDNKNVGKQESEITHPQGRKIIF